MAIYQQRILGNVILHNVIYHIFERSFFLLQPPWDEPATHSAHAAQSPKLMHMGQNPAVAASLSPAASRRDPGEIPADRNSMPA
jgi:hypothetical protein